MPAWQDIARLIAAVSVLGAAVWGCGSSNVQRAGTKVTVASRPESGASVWIDGVPHGKTPYTVEGLPPGRIIVEADLEGYKRAWKAVEIHEGEEARIVLDLEPIIGFLTITSTPEGAKIFLDDMKLLGETPLREAPVPIGQRTYELALHNYFSVRAEVNIEKDFRYTFSHDLKPKPARLKLYSRPTGAQVWLNFVSQERLTPAEFALNPGQYTVAVYAQGYMTTEKTVTLGVNQEQTIFVTMEEGDAPVGMVLVPAGTFIFGVDGGSPDERPRLEVRVEAFYIDKYEVTNKQFQDVFPDHTFGKDMDYFPVTGVSWNQAVAYATGVGKRLPTEMEWEKAARGMDGREYPWGNVFDPKMCNSGASVGAKMMEVGASRAGASPFGCLDMAGNAFEWTADWYQAYPGNKDVIKEYGQIYRVLRGGSYLRGAFDVRCARRYYDRMDSEKDDYGFRCVKSVEEGSRDARRK